MILKDYLSRIIRKSRELWQYKIFRYAFIVHGFYFILSILLTLICFRDKNDFLVYYNVGKVFINDINNLYNPANYNWPFRYLPLSAILFVPFYLLGFDVGFILFNFINLILNILICIILYKLIFLIRDESHEKDDKRVILYISLYLMSLPNLFNYVLGQINLYVTLLMLLSLLIYFKYEQIKWQFIASLILGISIIVKPITVFMIPFLIAFNYDFKKERLNISLLNTVIRVFGVLLPLSLNFFIFLINPSLLKGFIAINFTGEDTVYINHSFSATKIIENLLFLVGFSEEQLLNYQLLIFLSTLLIAGGLSFLIYIFGKLNSENLIFGYTFGILIMLIAYFDSWDHHLLILAPILILLIFNLPQRSEITKNFIKPSFFFFIFLDLAFMGIWFLIQDWFPINFIPTLFLFLIFYGISKQCLKGDGDL
ncbi:MAG: glycosyltransferase 87 family protein [Candidatus Hodarchaeota archaeon]